jgi:type II secretory pathway component PulC
VVAANATESRAVIRSRVGDGGARTVLTGSPLDEARVVRIERRRILVDASGELGELDFDLDTGDESATEPGAPLTASPAPSSAPGAPVSRAGDGAYEIDGETFRRISADPAALMRDARFVPDTVRTGAGGWRVFALKPGSLFAQLGLVDGDVLRAIGSTRLAGLDATLAGLTELRDAHAFEVTLERGQIERTLRYRVR